jgi:hypothetical protein
MRNLNFIQTAGAPIVFSWAADRDSVIKGLRTTIYAVVSYYADPIARLNSGENSF